MNDDGAVRADLRELGKSAIRAEVVQRAMVLLDQRGFDHTTVEEIAAAVGISPRSFFRYFATKEDLVVSEITPLGRLVEDALLGRPEDEAPWDSLRASLAPLVRTAENDPDNVLRSTRVALSTTALRARTLERHAAWAASLSPIIARRMTAPKRHVTMAADALAQSALACLYVATVAWVASDGADSYEELLDEAFDAVGRV
jgi:AcrR family transcriptional regulator